MSKRNIPDMLEEVLHPGLFRWIVQRRKYQFGNSSLHTQKWHSMFWLLRCNSGSWTTDSNIVRYNGGAFPRGIDNQGVFDLSLSGSFILGIGLGCGVNQFPLMDKAYEEFVSQNEAAYKLVQKQEQQKQRRKR